MSDERLPRNVMVVGSQGTAIEEDIRTRQPTWTVESLPDYQSAVVRLKSADDLDVIVAGAEAGAVIDLAAAEQSRLARIALRYGDGAVLGAQETVDIANGVDELCRAIERAAVTQIRLHDPGLQSALARVEGLPSPPELLQELRQMLDQPGVEVSAVAALIEQDAAMAGRLLKLVNSSAFGLSQRVSDLTRAIALLGLNTVANITSAVMLVDCLGSYSKNVQKEFATINSHSAQVAGQARTQSGSDDAFAAGLLHDVGLMALLVRAPDSYFALRELSNGADPSEFESREMDLLGANHATIGAWLLSSWNLPRLLVDAVARSHDADSWEVTSPITCAVYVAEQAVSSADRRWWEPSSIG